MGLTQAEMDCLFRQLRRDVESKAADHPDAFPLGKAVWSLDNAPAHLKLLRELPAEELNLIPACSPDIHKAVEHPLAAFKRAWGKEFTADTRCKSCESAMALAAAILNRTTPSSIEKDLNTLPDTMRSIVRHGGNWADAALC